MEQRQANEQMIERLNLWDPLGYGIGFYQTEIVDVVQAVHVIDDPKQLARKIQSIYEFSFEKIIPLKECEEIAMTLLFIKNNASCEI